MVRCRGDVCDCLWWRWSVQAGSAARVINRGDCDKHREKQRTASMRSLHSNGEEGKSDTAHSTLHDRENSRWAATRSHNGKSAVWKSGSKAQTHSAREDRKRSGDEEMVRGVSLCVRRHAVLSIAVGGRSDIALLPADC